MVERILFRAAQSEVKRADDNEATIKNRIHTFRTNTEAILSQYGDKVKRVSWGRKRKNKIMGLLIMFFMISQIPADRPVDDIFNDVVSNIDQLFVARK